MRLDELKIANVGGVWNTNPDWSALYWGGGVDAGVERLELIAEDWTFTFKTVEQKFPSYQLDGSRLMCRYGP